MKATRLSTREVARAYTYDPSDCACNGYMIQLYTDGHLAITYQTRWQGSRTGQRYITDAGYLDPHNPYGVTSEHRDKVLDADLRAHGLSFDDDIYHGNGRVPHGFHQTREGWIIR